MAQGWTLDALAYLDAARAAGIPAVLERSRSGDGGHVWVFFSERVPASSARRIGAYLLREAMTARAEIDLVSYDRLFPAQDFLPRQGFGNLIALPLQGECRNKGTTVFLDPSTLDPYPDQWEFLASVDRLSREAALALAETLGDVPVGPDARELPPSHSRPGFAPSACVDTGVGFRDAGGGPHRAATVLAGRAEACRVIAQSRLLRKGEEPVLDRQHATVHPLLPRDARPATTSEGRSSSS